ncbi:MAG TPA: sugar ABC transporter permease [Caldilineaceae bacterium]|nr:sugar ABC transporter permease [Caldilineaceae bacterium]
MTASTTARRRFLTGMAFISLWMIGFFVFNLYPMAASLYYSFTEYHVKQPLVWIGLQNYLSMVNDDLFWRALYNTIYMVLFSVPLSLLISFICALLLNIKIPGQSIYRVIYYLPSIVPVVASTLLWLWILNPNSGILNTTLAQLGIRGPNWTHDPFWSKPSLIFMGLWGVGNTMVIYLAGLQDIPNTLIEASELDGATWWQRLWRITVPLISPITLFNLIIGVIGTFQYFAQAYVLSADMGSVGSALGAPLNSTLFYSVYLYQQGFVYLKMGYASAQAWVLFVIIMLCTIFLLRSSERWTYYEGG